MTDARWLDSSHSPIVQLSIDVTTIEEAISVGEMGLRAGVDWLEFGTPLVSFQGINSFGAFTSRFPDAVTFLDAKIMDGSARYVQVAADLGINMVCLCASASDATFRAAVAAGADTGVKVVGDLYAVDPPFARALQLQDLGVDAIFLHYGFDQSKEAPELNRTTDQLATVRSQVSLPLGIVTFDPPSGIAAVEAGADILLIGHPYLVGAGAEEALSDYVRQVKAAGSARRGTRTSA